MFIFSAQAGVGGGEETSSRTTSREVAFKVSVSGVFQPPRTLPAWTVLWSWLGEPPCWVSAMWGSLCHPLGTRVEEMPSSSCSQSPPVFWANLGIMVEAGNYSF